MKTQDVFPSRWLTGDVLPHPVAVTIQRVVLEKVRDPHTRRETQKPVAYFVGKRKALILNVTNWRTLVGLYGDESDNWAGKKVVLYAEEVDTPNGRMKAVRVRRPNGEPAQVVEEDDDDADDAPGAPQQAQTAPHEALPTEQPADPMEPAPGGLERQKLTPQQLMAALEKKAMEYEKAGNRATAQQLGLLMGLLNDIIGGDDRRHAVLGWLWGVRSAKEMTQPQVLAMLDHLKPTKAGKGQWATLKVAQEELRDTLALVEQLPKAQAPVVVHLPEDDPLPASEPGSVAA